MEIPLPDGGLLHVALGQDQAINPADSRVYAIKWAQDDAGRLVVLDVLSLGAQAPGLGFPALNGLDDASSTGSLGVVIGRPSGSGLRRRKGSAPGADIKRTSSLTRLLNAGIDLLLGSKSAATSLDSGSGHSSSSGGPPLPGAGSGGLPLPLPPGVAGKGRLQSSSGGGGAAELGERGYHVNGQVPGSPKAYGRQ